MLCCGLSVQAQLRNDDVYEQTEMDRSPIRDEIRIPDAAGYKVLKCDFHIHTVFSDGLVWPDIRVMEAWQEGLDAIAITDHIEYRPHKEVLKGDLNESYKIAAKAARSNGLIVIHGTEITRSKPLGHLNALFIEDAEPMKVEDQMAAIDEAVRQKAFILWNHPGWPDDKSTLYPVHEELIKAGKIHGVEVFNHKEHYPLALDWPAEKGLAFTANTDVHGLVNTDYTGLRPMTLVFATERSEQGIREALFARRTVAFFDGLLAGSPELLTALLKASLKIQAVNEKTITVTNLSDIPFRAIAKDRLYILPAGKTIRMSMPEADTQFTLENCLTGHNKKLTVSAAAFDLD